MNAPVTGLWRVPFSSAKPTRIEFAPGLTVAEMVEVMNLPVDFDRHGTVLIGGHVIDRTAWRRIKPKPGRKLTFHYALTGGDDKGGGLKAVLGIVLAVATVLTAGLALTGTFAAGGWFVAGSTSARILSAGISLVGALASAALSAPPASAPGQEVPGLPQNRGPAAVSGNILRAGGPTPRVVGERWTYPPFGCQPLVVRDGLDEWVEAIYVLAGPHYMPVANINIGDTPIEDSDDVEYQVREGWLDDPVITMVTRYGATQDVRLEMSAHQVKGEDYFSLVNQTTPSRSLPKFHKFAASRNCDEIWFHFTFPGGLNYVQDPDVRLQVPLRIRIRASSSDPWINLPELHIRSKSTSELKPTVKLIWGSPAPVGTVPANEGFVAAYKLGKTQLSPSSPAWEAHSSFSDGAGDDGLYNGVEGSTNVLRTVLTEHEATFYLDESVIPKGDYQLEVKRGQSINGADWNFANYTRDGTVVDLFFYYNDTTARIRGNKEYISDRMYLLRIASVFNSHPIMNGEQGSGLAIIAIKALNRQVPNLSVRAAGWVKDWDGTGWNTWVHGGQYIPAHYRDVLRGSLSPDPIDEAIIDEDSLVDWRTACIANDFTCDMICEGAGVDEVLTKMAGCGYARPYASETWGVIRDYDRSEEEPVQIFSSRNSAGLSMAKAFARIPDALRCTYKNADDLDADREIFVYRPGREGTPNPRIEAITYEGLVEEAKIIKRAKYDLQQLELRSDFWSMRVPFEAIVCRRGDLVGLNHDVIDKTHQSARVLYPYISSGFVTGVELDSSVPVYDEPDMHEIVDMHGIEDMHLVGIRSAISIRQLDQMDSQHQIVGPTGVRSTLEFATPIALETVEITEDGETTEVPVIGPDTLAKIGKPGKIVMRTVVAGVTYDTDFFGAMTVVAEAPELFQDA